MSPVLIPDHGRVFQGIFLWLITLFQTDIEEKGQSPTMDRQWLKKETISSFPLIKHIIKSVVSKASLEPSALSQCGTFLSLQYSGASKQISLQHCTE